MKKKIIRPADHPARLVCDGPNIFLKLHVDSMAYELCDIINFFGC